MNRQDRARQFMPFASLKGYFDKIREQQKIKEPKKELSDSEAERLSFKLNQLQKGQMITVTYYDEDAYETVEGLISNYDENFRTLTIVKTVISFDDILDINGENIKSLDEI
ncbi:MAG: YolD-like family protein [Candidatus Gastranaerophilaceae bacterium]